MCIYHVLVKKGNGDRNALNVDTLYIKRCTYVWVVVYKEGSLYSWESFNSLLGVWQCLLSMLHVITKSVKLELQIFRNLWKLLIIDWKPNSGTIWTVNVVQVENVQVETHRWVSIPLCLSWNPSVGCYDIGHHLH